MESSNTIFKFHYHIITTTKVFLGKMTKTLSVAIKSYFSNLM